jgi:hypothetical protein
MQQKRLKCRAAPVGAALGWEGQSRRGDFQEEKDELSVIVNLSFSPSLSLSLPSAPLIGIA